MHPFYIPASSRQRHRTSAVRHPFALTAIPTESDRLEWLYATTQARPGNVDADAAVIRSIVAAQLGPFKTPGRGRFSEASLRRVVELGNAERDGLMVYYDHPSDTGRQLGTFIGRAKSFRMGQAIDARTRFAVSAAICDLHFNATALAPQPGGGQSYFALLSGLAASDPEAISTSLILSADESESYGDTEPLWMPRSLHSLDIVAVGDAVDGLIGVG